jgi:SapC
MAANSKNPESIQTVDVSRHGKLRVKANPGFAHASLQHVAPVVLSELAVCASNFPLIFLPRPGDGKLLLAAMLGLRPGENIYHGPEFWDSTYVPLAIQRYPFVAGYDDRLTDVDEITTCLEINSPLLSEKEGTPLFTADGEQTDFFKSKHQLLSNMFDSQRLTELFVDAVVDLGLVSLMNLHLQQQNGEIRRVTGLFALDEKKMKNLSPEQFLQLHKADFLPACYLIMASLHQLTQLVRLRNRKGKDQLTNFRIELNVEPPAAK